MPLKVGQMLKLYVPLAVLAGLVVALPTLAAESGVGRGLGVLCGVVLLTLFAWVVTRRVRRP
jgi:hypothetical protein